MISYSSRLSEIANADKLNQSYEFPHNDQLTTDKVLSFDGC